MKSVLKDIFILLLLLMVIVFALGIMFYSSMPGNKSIPGTIEYSQSVETTSTLQEIADAKSSAKGDVTGSSTSGFENGTVLASYTVGIDELTYAKQRNQYTPGKSDPFAEYVEPKAEENSNTTSTDTTTSSTSTTPTNTASSGDSSTGRLFENASKK